MGPDILLRFWEDERFIDQLTGFGIDVVTPQFAIDNVQIETCSWNGHSCN